MIDFESYTADQWGLWIFNGMQDISSPDRDVQLSAFPEGNVLGFGGDFVRLLVAKEDSLRFAKSKANFADGLVKALVSSITQRLPVAEVLDILNVMVALVPPSLAKDGANGGQYSLLDIERQLVGSGYVKLDKRLASAWVSLLSKLSPSKDASDLLWNAVSEFCQWPGIVWGASIALVRDYKSKSASGKTWDQLVANLCERAGPSIFEAGEAAKMAMKSYRLILGPSLYGEGLVNILNFIPAGTTDEEIVEMVISDVFLSAGDGSGCFLEIVRKSGNQEVALLGLKEHHYLFFSHALSVFHRIQARQDGLNLLSDNLEVRALRKECAGVIEEFSSSLSSIFASLPNTQSALDHRIGLTNTVYRGRGQ
jgi:hypothetical protein